MLWYVNTTNIKQLHSRDLSMQENVCVCVCALVHAFEREYFMDS